MLPLRIASLLGGLAQSLGGAAAALLARDLGGSDAVAGLPQAVLVVGSAVAALGMSALSRRYGRPRALAAGLAVATGGSVVVVFAGDLLGLLAGTLLLGAGTAAVMLGRYAAADSAPEGARARAMATVLVATTVGAVAGPNLLVPADALGRALGLPGLGGAYVVAALCFAIAAGLLLRLPARPPAVEPDPRGAVPGGTAVRGLAVLALANLVMVGVMTMAPVHLHHLGAGLGAIGLVVSLHVAGMFAPAPLSGRLTDRWGAVPTTALAGAMLVVSALLAAVGAGAPLVLGVALVLLGVGWNLGLVAGSTLLTAGVPAAERPRREGWGEVAMGVAAGGGGAASGAVMSGGGYGLLASAGAAVAALVVAAAWQARVSGCRNAARPAPAPSPPRPRGPSAAPWSPARRGAGG
ncbi:putative MFS family arabinose efflux permease [Pseudonocardia hierapolitana]|uniref:Putative MFS family arabinose efflux permease n=1 Tax=Pseudonocardia hierapolitana TaxID=1128676 RepID=A0A561SNW8_9PSEU|nr:MFS transporter [Pseudonocardia hierapolitana]TWF76558.1 putative MFS family arabinose efflux permease [Pseudonocardia hierapolitana]